MKLKVLSFLALSLISGNCVFSEAATIGLLKPEFKNNSQFFRDIETVLNKAVTKVSEAKKNLQDEAIVLSQKAEAEFRAAGITSNPESSPAGQSIISKYKKMLRDKEDAVETANQDLSATQTELSEKFEEQVRKASLAVCEESKLALVVQYDKNNPFIIAANPKMTVDVSEKVAAKLDELAEKNVSLLKLDTKKMLLADNSKNTETLVAKVEEKNSANAPVSVTA